MAKHIMKKILMIFIGLIIIYLTTEWLVRGLHYVLFQSYKYISFAAPLVHLTKYFAVAIALTILFKRYSIPTSFGKQFISMVFIFSIVGLVVSSLWFNAVNGEKILKYRLIFPITKTWDEVDFVSSRVYKSDPVNSNQINHLEPRHVITKYYIHFKNDSKVNLWSDIDSVYRLHQLALEKNIEAEYLTKSDHFDQHYGSYFKDSLSKAYVVFGVNDK